MIDAFEYADHFLFRLARVHDPARPLQIELHPGIHCDLYRCPYCYGHGQYPMAGPALSVEEIGKMLDDLRPLDPLIIVSGITTEPLTHPNAAGILNEIRKRNFGLGLYTKGYRFDNACTEALHTGDAECFVTFSVDASNKADYNLVHGITVRPGSSKAECADGYFHRVVSNIRNAWEEKQRRRSSLQIRVSMLLLNENSEEDDLVAAIAMFADMADVIRFSLPQDRNDGHRASNLPQAPKLLLARIAARFKDNPRVRVLESTSEPSRDTNFRLCHAQRFQALIDRSGNVFPCPQVAVSNYSHLSFGNIRTASIRDILRSPERHQRFDWDVDKDMRCRICDRKDESVNVALGRLDNAFSTPPARRTNKTLVQLSASPV